jgi:hypothetical protein
MTKLVNRRSKLLALGALVLCTASWIAPSPYAFACSPKGDHDLCKKKGNAWGIGKKEVSKLVSKLQSENKIGQYTLTPIPGGDVSCKVAIAPIVQSVETPLTVDGDEHNYVVALITNPDGCTAPKFDLKEGETAAWIVNFNYTGSLPHKGDKIGTSWIVGLKTGLGGWDSEMSGSDKWRFTHCETSHEPPNYDNAAFFRHADLCPTLDHLKHNATSVASALVNALTQKSPSANDAADDDPALWFRCGGDCCYSDSFYK